jgi:hypothetical protein
VSGSGIPTDTVVYTPERFNEYRDVVGTVIHPAVREALPYEPCELLRWLWGTAGRGRLRFRPAAGVSRLEICP